jgi:hypothetical protein
MLTMGALHRVLTLLLEENVPISNLTRILESLGNQPPALKDPGDLVERVWVDLGRIVCDRFRDAQGKIAAIMLDPRMEMELRRAIHDKNLIIDPPRLEKLIVLLANAWRKAMLDGRALHPGQTAAQDSGGPGASEIIRNSQRCDSSGAVAYARHVPNRRRARWISQEQGLSADGVNNAKRPPSGRGRRGKPFAAAVKEIPQEPSNAIARFATSSASGILRNLTTLSGNPARSSSSTLSWSDNATMNGRSACSRRSCK